MSRSTQLVYALSFVVAACGLFVPMWPLCVIGILIAALSGRWVFAILTGLLIDLAWGAPQGMFAVVYVPFALVGVAGSLAWYFFAGYFLDRSPSDTL